MKRTFGDARKRLRAAVLHSLVFSGKPITSNVGSRLSLPNRITSVVKRIGEALMHRSALFLTTTEKLMGVSPDVSFKTMTRIYLGDLAARASIDFLADQIAGAGFYTTMNNDYVEKSDGRTAKELVDEFCGEHGWMRFCRSQLATWLVGGTSSGGWVTPRKSSSSGQCHWKLSKTTA